MLLRLDAPKLLSDIIAIISELVLEVRIKVNKSGMSIIAIDPANVALISFKLPAEAFSQIEVEEEVLGVSLDSLKSVLKRSSPGSSLVLQTEENTLKIQIQDKIKREFKLSLIEIDTEEKTMPTLEFLSKIEMPSIDLAEAIEDCGIVADACSFISLPDKFTIEAKGSLNSAKSDFSSDEVRIETQLGTTEENKEKGIRSRYSLEYLQKFIKASKLTEKAIINFSNDYPLKLEFKTPRMELAFVLAPRVETED
jgi:proliferating cell nuclear antigen